MACTDEEIGARLLAIREALGLKQPEFVQEVAKRTGHRYSVSAISKKENGVQSISPCDIARFALMDPAGRGREWLAFGVWEPRRPRQVEGLTFDDGSPVTLNDLAPRPRLVAEVGHAGPAIVPPDEPPMPTTRLGRKRPK